MEGYASVNDLNEVIAADKKHVWHHLIQHKMFETVDPRVIVEGKGLRVALSTLNTEFALVCT